MRGPCLCGDTACPYCGPAQGYDPDFEAEYERVFTWVEHTFPNLAEGEAEKVVDGIAAYGDLWDWLVESIRGWQPGDKPKPFDPDTVIVEGEGKEIQIVDLIATRFSAQENS